jgi:CheY-like chemotaxis protein
MMLHTIDVPLFEDKQALIVEDDAHNLVALGSLLKGLRIQFKRNTTGANVLEQAHRLRPDFILLDVDLPDGDAFAIYQRIRSSRELRDIPVIALYDQHATRQLLPRILASGFTAYIAKPIAQRDFEDLLRSILFSHPFSQPPRSGH